MTTVSIGFRAKTGRAIAIALARDKSGPVFAARWNVSLYDPRVPATGQPHHEVMELPWKDAQVAVRKFESRIENLASRELDRLLKDLESRGYSVGSVAVVGSPDRNLEKIGNPHIRAHAAEGILFRHVLEVAAAEHQLQCRSLSDRDLEKVAVSELHQKPEALKAVLAAIGQSAGRPWRTDERAAATAAWLMLAVHGQRAARAASR